MNLIARNHSRKEALLLGLGQHVGHTRNQRVVRVHIVIVQHHEDIVLGPGDGEVPLGTDGQRLVQQDVGDVGQVCHQVLNLVLTIVHNDPLNLVLWVCLGNHAVFCQREEGTTVASECNHGDRRQVLFFRKAVFQDKLRHILESKKGLLHRLHEESVAVLILLAVLIRQSHFSLGCGCNIHRKRLYDRLYTHIFKVPQALRVWDDLGGTHPQRISGELTEWLNRGEE